MASLVPQTNEESQRMRGKLPFSVPKFCTKRGIWRTLSTREARRGSLGSTASAF